MTPAAHRGPVTAPTGLALVTGVLCTTARLGLAARVTEDISRVLGRPATALAAVVARDRAEWPGGSVLPGGSSSHVRR